MKPLFSLALAVATLAIGQAQAPQKPVALFDGRSFAGWEGDIKGTWRIQDGAIVGGSQTAQVPRNEFLTTTRSFGDFVLRVRFRLVGTEGFINGGVQFRSRRLEKPAHEMTRLSGGSRRQVLGQPVRRVAPQQDARRARREADRRDPEAWRLERLRDPRGRAADPAVDQRPADDRLHRNRPGDPARGADRPADPRRRQGRGLV